ncbi:MAG: DUF1697 domain-containing protein [Actinobacteria bacterium]|nr:DUF1697 domain-containing protein [Actinomycetota bacterium]MBO0832295.1 DUF1697 domain-containing protein [Actinomycetota bacterium]MBO0836706.1 DUF1697 domain-containing protein [Actinomycetota bacterium]
MPRYLALLRGINVGGHNKVAMADLRQIAADLGYTDISTYIQSGNLMFSSDDPDAAGHADLLQKAIAERLGVHAGVVVLTAGELDAVITGNPFPNETNDRCVHAVLRTGPMDSRALTAVAEAVRKARERGSRDNAIVVGQTLYLHTPDGFGRSDLAARLVSSAAQAGGTARNWATVNKLRALLAETQS